MIFSTFHQNSTFDEKQEEYADLPPNQRRKRIQAKLDMLKNNMNQENAVR